MYAASQAGVEAISPYVEALLPNEKGANGKWKRVIDDMGFPAGGPRTMTADLTGKLPPGTRKIRITTNLQIYWDSILIDRTEQQRRRAGSIAPLEKTRVVGMTLPERTQPMRPQRMRLMPVPLVRADLEFHGYPLKIEGTPPGNVQYVYEKASATGPYTRPSGTYTRYGDVLPLLTATDDKLAVFGSGDEVQLDFDPPICPRFPRAGCAIISLPPTATRKTWTFTRRKGTTWLRCHSSAWANIRIRRRSRSRSTMRTLNYLLEYNTRHMSGNEQRGYWFDYGERK